MNGGDWLVNVTCEKDLGKTVNLQTEPQSARLKKKARGEFNGRLPQEIPTGR